MREKLIELIEQADGHSSLEIHDINRFVDSLIANGVTIQQWIPVTERLPDAGTNCLCFTGSTMQIAMYEGNYRWWTHYHSHTVTGKNWFTHWMPLPEPPKGVEQ